MNAEGASPRLRADQRALAAIAQELLRTGVGAKMTTSVELQERLDVGSGTVQKATKHLVDAGAVDLRVRGHQGTIIERLDPLLAWRAADLAPLRVVLPPPGSLESAAIGLGLRGRLGEAHIPVEFDFVRGAHRRVQRLQHGDDPVLIVLSRGAAHAAGVLDDGAHAWLDLGPESYYSAASLVVVEHPDRPVRRVAHDADSFDHVQLTTQEFGSDVELVRCPFVQVPAAVLAGQADAGVWHRVVTSITPAAAGLRVRPLTHNPTASEQKLTNAVLVWRASQPELGTLLSAIQLDEIATRRASLLELGVEDGDIAEQVPWL